MALWYILPLSLRCEYECLLSSVSLHDGGSCLVNFPPKSIDIGGKLGYKSYEENPSSIGMSI